MANQYVNKVQKSDGTTIIDITDTTATAADVATGKYFYAVSGEKTEGLNAGGNAFLISDTTDTAGGTIRTATAIEVAGTKSITDNGTYDVTSFASADVSVPASAVDTGTKSISISSNGTTTHDVVGYASASVTANVPNSYSAGDEGKVVSSGALVSQTSDTVTANDTYDTTLINSLTVNVSGGGGVDLSPAALPMSQNSVGGMFQAMTNGDWGTLEISVTSGTNPIIINFGRPIKGYACYPKNDTCVDGLEANDNTALAFAFFEDPDGTGAQSLIYCIQRTKTSPKAESTLFYRVSSFTFVNGVLSLVPQYPTNKNWSPFGFGHTYRFVYWW